jgi:hypothetical protein
MALPHILGVSGEGAECAQREQAVEPRPLTPPLTPRCLPVGPGALQGAAARQDASDIAGIGKALDRGGQNLDYDPARADREGGGVIHEGGRNFKSEGLHFGSLRIM